MTSDCRGEARGAKAEALDVVARHRHLHHLDRAAGETERHPHQRARARPGDQIVGGGNEEALVGKLVVDLEEERIIGADRPAGGGIENALRRLRDRGRRACCCRAQSHSSAPFFHS
jgi:hypothetical protein